MAGITAFHLNHVGPAQATAGTAQSFIMGVAPRAGVLTAMKFIPVAAGAADATNYRTWTIQNRGQAGSGTTSMATVTTNTVGGAANVAYDERAGTLSGTAANLVVAVGDVIACVETIAGTGLAHSGYLVDLSFDNP